MIEIDNFYNYIKRHNTESVYLFKSKFGNIVELLPTIVCSSKVIYNILSKYSDIYTDITKQQAFRNLFNDYFRWRFSRVLNKN